MYCRIYEPSARVINYGERFSEMYFIQQGGVKFYDS